jgi:hypothetical protein
LAVSGDKYFVVDYKSKDAADSLKVYNNRMVLLKGADVKDIIVRNVD